MANLYGKSPLDVIPVFSENPHDGPPPSARSAAAAYDIRHATIEGGLSWPLTSKMIRPHIGAVFVKDFDWVGRKAEHVPLGEGRVDPKFFKMLQDDGFDGPYSIHVEYLGGHSEGENMEALKRDLTVFRRWLAA